MPPKLRKLLIISLIIRVFLAFAYEGTGDTGAFCHAGALAASHHEVYADPTVYFSAPPLGLHITAAMNWIATATHLPCSGMWKMPSVIADCVIVYMIYLIARAGRDTERALTMARWYAYNPIALFVSAYHGQQDAFWLAGILIAYHLIQSKKSVALAGMAAGISLAYKIPAVLVFPPLILTIKTYSSRVRFVAIAGIVFGLSLLPEILTSTRTLVRQSFMYSSTPGVWGISLYANKILMFFGADAGNLNYVQSLLKIALAVAIIIYIFMVSRRAVAPLSAALGIISLFLIFTPGFGVQYLLWPLPFMILTDSPILAMFTTYVTFAFLHVYNLYIPPINSFIELLQRAVYYPLQIVYPYEILVPVWLLIIVAQFGLISEARFRVINRFVHQRIMHIEKLGYDLYERGASYNQTQHVWDRYFIRVVAVGYALTTLIYYAPAYGGYFQQDEWFFMPYFARLNQSVYAPILALLAPFRDPQAFAFHVTPIGTFLWWLEISLFKLHYGWYMTFSLGLHTAIGTLIAIIVNRLCKNRTIAILAGLIFITTSTHFQAVTWVNAHINTQISLLLGLMSFWSFTAAIRENNKRQYYLSIMYFMASLLTKETMLLLFFVIPLYTYIEKGTRQLRKLRLFYASCASYLVLRLMTPQIVNFFSHSSNPTAAIADKNTDILFSLYYASTFLLKGITQSLIPQQTIGALTAWITEVGYPQYNGEKAVGGINYLTFTQSAGQDIVMYMCAFVIVIGFVVFALKYRANTRTHRAMAVGVLWTIMSILPFTFLSGWLLKLFPYISGIDSRHLYGTNVGMAILMAIILYALCEKIDIQSRPYPRVRAYIKTVPLVLIVVWLVLQWQALTWQIENQNTITRGRREIVNMMLAIKPRLGQQTVFYSSSNVALYGFADLMLPFQNNPGQVILSAYAMRQRLPKPFLTPQFLMKGLTEQWYQKYDDTAIGYYLDKKSLYRSAVNNHIDPANIYGLGYDGHTYTVTDVTSQVRGDLAGYLSERGRLTGWKTYENSTAKYSLYYPPEYTIVKNNNPSTITSIALTSPEDTRPLLDISMYETETPQPSSTFVENIDDGTGYPIGQDYTFEAYHVGPIDTYTAVTNKNRVTSIVRLFNTYNARQIIVTRTPPPETLTEKQRIELNNVLKYLDFYQ